MKLRFVKWEGDHAYFKKATIKDRLLSCFNKDILIIDDLKDKNESKKK